MRKPIFFLLFLAFFLPGLARAEVGAWQTEKEVAVRLVSAVKGTRNRSEVLLGLDIKLAEGWHTYWRDPGGAGEPPRFDWTGSENLAEAVLLYPAPTRYGEGDAAFIGYKGDVLMPLRIALKDQGRPLALKGKLHLFICKELCLPKTFPLALTLPADTGEASPDAALIEKALQTVPPAEKGEPALPFWSLLLLALLGGFILNLMPCVLPVLSLKIMGLVKHSGKGRRATRRAFLSTAGGIVFSFMALALAAIALKATGQAIGWGAQFQHPLFLIFMTTVLTFFACNLLGFFEIGLPQTVAELTNPRKHPHLASDFAVGALATLLATPCSAPFLGTAIAFALASSWREILAVFFLLGVGMGLPYFAVALWPRLASALPRPGAWMVWLSRLLGLGLAATALWLLYVLRHQMERSAVVFVALCMGAIGLQLFLRHKGYLRFLTIPVLAAALLGAFGLGFVASAPSASSPESGAWETFDEAALARRLSEGKIVFVDVTADWCLTCKVNKRLTLARDDVRARLFDDPRVAALQADWTNPNPLVMDFLKKHGRYGIPFNIVFGPGAPQGLPLPEILTPSIVIEAIDKAGRCGQKKC